MEAIFGLEVGAALGAESDSARAKTSFKKPRPRGAMGWLLASLCRSTRAGASVTGKGDAETKVGLRAETAMSEKTRTGLRMLDNWVLYVEKKRM
jgi:hypothetical protein